MKTTIEVGGYEIMIEEMEGNITVSASKEGEVVEEFELAAEDFESQGGEMSEDDEMGDDEMMSFGDDDMEEEGDFGDDDMEEGEEEGEEEEFGQEEEEEEEGEGKLESFSYFVKNRKK